MPVLWDPEVLARIEALHLRARELVDGVLHGGHLSRRSASAVEFADYKEYSPGDPIRHLDWRVAARTDRLVIRRHRVETELAVTLVLDASADIQTGSAGKAGRPPLDDGSKWATAATLAATVAYFLHKRAEPVGLMVLGGEEVRWPYMPPRSSAGHLAQLFGVIAETRPAGRAELAQGLARLGPRLGRRTLVVLLSDLMEEPAEWGPQLSALGARAADLRVVHLHDPAEWALELGTAGRFFSPEGGEAIPIDPDAARGPFAEVVAEYLEEVRSHLQAWRAQHILAPTDTPLDVVASRVLRGLP